MQPDVFRDERKAEARSGAMASPPSGAASREAIEDHAPLGFGHTRAFVLHGDDGEVTFVPDSRGSHRAVLCGVVDQLATT